MCKIFLFFLIYSTTLFGAIKAIVFDFGGVIAKVDRSAVIALILKTFPDADPSDFDDDKLYLALEKGESFWKDYAFYHRQAHPLGQLPRGWMERLDQVVDQMVIVDPEVKALVEELKGEGYIVSLVSNTSEVRARFFRQRGDYAAFSPVLISSELGIKKPDPQIYRILLSMLNLRAGECLFIDNKRSNVEAAKRLGMKGIVFTSAEQLKADLTNLLPRIEKAHPE